MQYWPLESSCWIASLRFVMNGRKEEQCLQHSLWLISLHSEKYETHTETYSAYSRYERCWASLHSIQSRP